MEGKAAFRVPPWLPFTLPLLHIFSVRWLFSRPRTAGLSLTKRFGDCSGFGDLGISEEWLQSPGHGWPLRGCRQTCCTHTLARTHTGETNDKWQFWGTFVSQSTFCAVIAICQTAADTSEQKYFQR